MTEIITLHWITNETVEVMAVDGGSVLNLGIYSRHELGWLAEHFRDLAESLDPQQEEA
jgi:hypothetical protein